MRVSPWLILVLASCAAKDPTPRKADTTASLGPGVAAVVGPWKLTTTTVAAVARARSLGPREARDRVVEDALEALAAFDRMSEAEREQASSVVLARATLTESFTNADAAPITDDDWKAATQAAWQRFDRPVSYRGVHLVVQFKEGAPAAEVEEAKALAESARTKLLPLSAKAAGMPLPSLWAAAAPRIRASQRPTDPAEALFLKEAKALLRARRSQKRVEGLPAITADGRVVDLGARPDTMFDPAFATAMSTLKKRGEISRVFRSPFGFHVIMLLQVIAPDHRPEAEQRRLLRPEIRASRRAAAQRALLNQLRQKAAVKRPANVDTLLELVTVTGE